jgi:hypothetical protein
VGESAPASGAFFYRGDSAMLRYMQRATEAVLGVGSGELRVTKHSNGGSKRNVDALRETHTSRCKFPRISTLTFSPKPKPAPCWPTRVVDQFELCAC